LDRIKIKNYFGIIQQAGYIIYGGETLEDYTKKIYLILCDRNAGKNTLKLAEKLKEKYKVLMIEDLGELLNHSNTKIIGIKNKNLSEIIEKMVEE